MKIMIIDDEKNIRRLIGDYLKNEGFQVVEGMNGYDALEKLRQMPDVDLALLDIRMPKMNGFETYVKIRAFSDVPIIFLTALDDTYHEVKALNLGAHDFINKPFSYEVLVARVNACLSKVKKKKKSVYNWDTLQINMNNRELLISGQDVGVTQKEFMVLELLINNKNMAIERDQILNHVWGHDYYGDPRTVDTHIKTLRAKMQDYGSLIKTVRGVGYYFKMDAE